MDIHREVIGTQYYLYGALQWFPIEFVMNEKMILVNQYMSRLVFEEGLVLCVTKSSCAVTSASAGGILQRTSETKGCCDWDGGRGSIIAPSERGSLEEELS